MLYVIGFIICAVFLFGAAEIVMFVARMIKKIVCTKR